MDRVKNKYNTIAKSSSLEGRKRILAWTLMILIVYVILLTGCTSTIGFTPNISTFTVTRSGSWLRVSAFGACFGTGALPSAPSSCASILTSSLPSDQPLAASLSKHARKMQLATFPIFTMLSAALYLVSAIATAKANNPGYAVYIRNMAPNRPYRWCVMYAAWASVCFAIVALFQTWVAVTGMAGSAVLLDSPDLAVSLSLPGLALQIVALVLQAVYVGFVYHRYSKAAGAQAMHAASRGAKRSRRRGGAGDMV